MKTNKTFTSLFILSLIAILWSSCGCTQTPYTHSGARHLPLKEKNDFQIATDFNGIQIGYSPFKSLGIQGSYFNRGKKLNHFEEGDLFYCEGKNLITDIAIGSYHAFSNRKKKKNESLLLGAYLGYGQGKFTSTFVDESSYEFKFQNYFQQLDIQYLSPRFQIGYFFKREVYDLKDGKFSFGEEPYNSAIEFNIIAASDLSAYYSSSLKAAIQLEPIWMFANITLSHQSEDFNFYPDRSVQAGFAIDINTLLKKISQKK